ncbi:hypothetical protein [Spirosoma utsteinense]|uniref:Carboxypeptidase-like regulatory domain-containing protein n=1 Tax=Spirosoma utsteinense TaxID=2585773 RepID=A0ABR6W3D8_9BACT|nr:hypothetical protein [Spirosoma utsteinense]MBC3789049.1 hypothetical protein [Spirosoma utsteinense]MBC3791114.1 hypothetical protein [Spirosoma utsteinense]
MLLRLLVGLVFTLSLSPVVAQPTYTLSGIVRYSASGQPIGQAAVVLDYDKVTTGTYTDAQGFLATDTRSCLPIVVVRSLGYLPFRTTLNLREHITLTVKLPAVSSQFEEVVITSKGPDRNGRIYNAEPS